MEHKPLQSQEPHWPRVQEIRCLKSGFPAEGHPILHQQLFAIQESVHRPRSHPLTSHPHPNLDMLGVGGWVREEPKERNWEQMRGPRSVTQQKQGSKHHGGATENGIRQSVVALGGAGRNSPLRPGEILSRFIQTLYLQYPFSTPHPPRAPPTVSHPARLANSSLSC